MKRDAVSTMKARTSWLAATCRTGEWGNARQARAAVEQSTAVKGMGARTSWLAATCRAGERGDAGQAFVAVDENTAAKDMASPKLPSHVKTFCLQASVPLFDSKDTCTLVSKFITTPKSPQSSSLPQVTLHSNPLARASYNPS